MICVGCEDGKHDRCLDGQMHSPEKPYAIECDCASHEHDYKKAPIGIHAPTTRTHVRTEPLSASRRTKPLK